MQLSCQLFSQKILLIIQARSKKKRRSHSFLNNDYSKMNEHTLNTQLIKSMLCMSINKSIHEHPDDYFFSFIQSLLMVGWLTSNTSATFVSVLYFKRAN
jgi:hypothetical protein